MASELRVNTLKDASGNNSVGLSFVANGSAKAWANFTTTTTTSILDSFNYSSIADNGTGDASLTVTSAMANINYAHLGMGGHGSTSLMAIMQQRNAYVPTTTVSRYQLTYVDSNLYDAKFGAVGLTGDLA